MSTYKQTSQNRTFRGRIGPIQTEIITWETHDNLWKWNYYFYVFNKQVNENIWKSFGWKTN